MSGGNKQEAVGTMVERLAETRSLTPATTIERAVEPVIPRPAGLALPLYAIQLILAYEWVLSGIDKVTDPSFASQLPAVLQGSTLVNRYSWYSSLLKQVVIPHASLLAPIVEVGELAIGILLAASAILWMWRPVGRPALYVGFLTCLALLGAVGLSVNYAFQQGTPLPWIDAAQAFSPGVGIDMLIALLSLPLLAANIWAVSVARRHQRALHRGKHHTWP